MAEKIEIQINAKDNASGVLKRLAGAFGNIAQIAGGILAAGVIRDVGREIIGLAKDSITAASDLNETWNKVGVIFGDATADITDFVTEMGTQIGQSTQQMLDAASTFGVFGKSAGLVGEDLAGFSTDLTVLASDLASFYNTSPEEAIIAIGAALRGESEPIRRFGVLLNEATLKEKALAMGIISTTKDALTPQQRVLAANAVIMDQTKDAQGDFMRTSDGLANSQRILAAQFQNAKVAMGEAFLPVAKMVSNFLSTTLMPAGLDLINKFIVPAGKAFEIFAGKLKIVLDYLKGGGDLDMGLIGYLFGPDVQSAIQDVIDFLQPLIDAFSNLFGVLIDSAPMVQGYMQTMWDFLVNVFNTYGPVIIESLANIVESLANIVDSLAALWQEHGATIMNTVGAIWEVIVVTITGALILITGAVDAALQLLQGNTAAAHASMAAMWTNFMNLVLSLVGTNLAEFNAVWKSNFEMAALIVTTVFENIKREITVFFIQLVLDAISFLRQFVDTWAANLDLAGNILQALFDRAYTILSIAVNQFYSFGQRLFEGLRDGISSRVGAVIDTLEQAWETISALWAKITGIASPSKVFIDYGENLMAGLAIGVQQGQAQAVDATGRAAQAVTNNAYYNLTINEAGNRGNVVRDFGLLQAMAGA